MSISRRSLLGGAFGAAAVVGLSACGGGGRGGESSGTQTGTASGAGSAAAGGGFPTSATIGVSLPWLGSQNWKEAHDIFTTKLKAAGYNPIIQSAENQAATQQQQISAMIQQGAKVIVVGPVDGKQLTDVLGQAKSAGIKVIGYDRMIEGTDAVSGVVQFGSVRTGELQGQSLLDGLKAKKGNGPYNIELFGGAPTDSNAPNFFTGAMKVLQPKIDDGTLVVVSGQKDFQKCAIEMWNTSKAQARMDSLLTGSYSGKKIDGVLCPNDGIARAVLTSCQQGGQPVPVVTGLDAENESVALIGKGTQWSTTHKPTDKLVDKTMEIIGALQKGEAMPATSDKTNNGKIDVPVYAIEPIIVTQANAKEVFANDPGRLKLLG